MAGLLSSPPSVRLSLRLVGAVLAMADPSGAGPTPAELDGTYVLFQQTTVVAKVPVLANLETSTITVSLHQLRHEGDRLRGPGQVCQIEMRSSSKMVQTELPAALRRILPGVQLNAVVGRNERGVTFRQAPTTVVLGALLEDPVHDPLPTTAQDSRVVDQDRDGHPGVTVRVKGLVSGEVYFTQRGTTELLGQQVGQGFRGKVRFRTEDEVLGASSLPLKMRTDTHPDFEKSRFRLDRVQGPMDCEGARRLAAGWE